MPHLHATHTPGPHSASPLRRSMMVHSAGCQARCSNDLVMGTERLYPSSSRAMKALLLTVCVALPMSAVTVVTFIHVTIITDVIDIVILCQADRSPSNFTLALISCMSCIVFGACNVRHVHRSRGASDSVGSAYLQTDALNVPKRLSGHQLWTHT